MSKERNLILNKKIINETVETIIDSIYEKTGDYMFEYGSYSREYEETNDEFFEDREEYIIEVIKELNNRIK